MALITGKVNIDYKKISRESQVNRAKVIHANSEDVEEMLNDWLRKNEDDFDIVDIQMSSCHFRDLQTKTTILILYKKKEYESNN